MPQDEVARPDRSGVRADRRAWPWSLGLFIAGLLVWEFVARAGMVSERVLPPASEVGTALVDLLTRGYFYSNVASTMKVIAAGFSIAFALGFVGALLLSLSQFMRRAVYPIVVTLDVIPKVTLIPLILIVSGFGMTSKIVIVASTTFFPIFIATLTGLTSVKPEGVSLLRSMGASRWQQFTHYSLPTAAPEIFAGVKISLTVAFIAAVISEFMIRNEGLGHLITSFRSALQVDFVLAGTLAVAAIGSVIYFATEFLERKLIFWQSTDDQVRVSA